MENQEKNRHHLSRTVTDRVLIVIFSIKHRLLLHCSELNRQAQESSQIKKEGSDLTDKKTKLTNKTLKA